MTSSWAEEPFKIHLTRTTEQDQLDLDLTYRDNHALEYTYNVLGLG